MSRRGYGGKIYFFRAAEKQYLTAFCGSGAGSEHIVQKQNVLANDTMPVNAHVGIEHIGPPLGCSRQTGLGLCMPVLFQKLHRRKAKLLAKGSGQKLRLIVTPEIAVVLTPAPR